MLTEVRRELNESSRLAIATRMVLILEYDGKRYHGLQMQTALPTVQGEVERALWKLTGEKTRVAAAGRTDAGVHARGQVVSFITGSSHSPQTFVNGMNYYLPGDIAVRAAYRVEDSFDVRRQAVSREYHYHILNSTTRSPLSSGLSYRVPGYLDIEAMNQACQALVGEHDLASFASDIGLEFKSTVRRVYRAEVSRDGELVVFKILANAFLPHQVRNTIGLLIRVGQGRVSVEKFCCIMGARTPGLAGPMAPAGGLCLIQVNYPAPFKDETC